MQGTPWDAKGRLATAIPDGPWVVYHQQRQLEQKEVPAWQGPLSYGMATIASYSLCRGDASALGPRT
eukprot:495782-Amphidinium_carterae.1